VNLRLAAAEIGVPGPIRTRKFRELAALTADAFQVPEPEFPARPREARLEDFARWTRDLAERTAADEAAAVSAGIRLRERSFIFGSRLRRILKPRNPAEVMRAARVLYRLIGIDFQGTEDGEIIVSRCFFSGIYAPSTCAMIAALDEGVLAGLAGGGSLRFIGRLTEGGDCCRARFRFPGDEA
jgi:hypothetical protein